MTAMIDAGHRSRPAAGLTQAAMVLKADLPPPENVLTQTENYILLLLLHLDDL